MPVASDPMGIEDGGNRFGPLRTDVLAERRLATIVRRFPPSCAGAILTLAEFSPRIADLVHVFPGAVVAMVTEHAGAAASREAVRLVENGAPLREVVHVLRVPMWLRRLPPEAFVRLLPQLPASEAFARRIVNHIPDNSAASGAWLEAVAGAASAGSEAFALWIAAQPLHAPRQSAPPLTTLSAYAWFSQAAGTRGKSLIPHLWRPDISLETALCSAKVWLNRLRLLVCFGRHPLADMWLKEGSANGYAFVALSNAEQILEEARQMSNCADQYALKLLQNRCRLFGVRRGTKHVASVEVGFHPRESGLLTITQLKAAHNIAAPLEVWQAALAWLSSQPALYRANAPTAVRRPIDRALWNDIMAPYWAAKGDAALLPRVLTHSRLEALDAELAVIAERGRVTSWLFT